MQRTPVDTDEKPSHHSMPPPCTPEEAKRPRNRESVRTKPDSGKPRYEKTPEQKGLMLILNCSEKRRGSKTDIEKLQQVFQSTLKFEVKCVPNITRNDVEAALVGVRDSYMEKAKAKEYYCFVCVVMSHGNEKGIKTSDNQYVTMDDITSCFTNEKAPEFLGKPKIFIVQACRGKGIQRVVESDGSSKDIQVYIEDYIGKMSVPNDADILIAYATTHGKESYRHPNSGAWFIEVLLQVIGENYKEYHFEDMLVLVRYQLAKRYIEGKCQMPCLWTTLTKRFYLR